MDEKRSTTMPFQPDPETLLATYAPDWKGTLLGPVASTGTDNAMYRLKGSAVLRVPKRPSAVALLEKELTHLPRLQGLPLQTPSVRMKTKCVPEDGMVFGILDWQDGLPATPDQIDDPHHAARALGGFLYALQGIDTDGAPLANEANHNRGAPIERLTDRVSKDIESLSDELDMELAHATWNAACTAPPPDRQVWVHGDIKADNLIAKNGQLSAVIDWGLSAVGDRAVDLAAAWTWVAPEACKTFQVACMGTDADWLRAKGWALYAATVSLAFYRGRSHTALCQLSRQTLARLEVTRST